MAFVLEHDYALLECNVSVNTNSYSSSVKGYQPHFKIIPPFLNIVGKVFPILSISLLYPKESFMSNFKTARKKRLFNGATSN